MPVAKKKRATSKKASNHKPHNQVTPEPPEEKILKQVKRIDTVDRPTTEILPVALTADEINLYAKESARLHGDVRKLEQMRKDGAAELKAKIGAIESRIVELNRKIESGQEDRNVPCFWRIDYTKGSKTLYRLQKTYGPEGPEEIRTYPLTPDERQPRLPLLETKEDRVVPPDNADKSKTPNEEEIEEWFDDLGKADREKAFGIRATSDLLEAAWSDLEPAEQEIVRDIWKARPAAESKAAG